MLKAGDFQRHASPKVGEIKSRADLVLFSTIFAGRGPALDKPHHQSRAQLCLIAALHQHVQS